MSPAPNDAGADQPLFWVWMAALGALLLAWVKKANPWGVLQKIVGSLNEPVIKKHVGPLREDISHIRRVIDHFPGAHAAHAAARAEEEEYARRWG